ncbi:MAG TPA: S8 family serine peptidase [Novosphingobium sp.]|nr:S8 family serine peptidase [Novosphingobium sp.]
MRKSVLAASVAVVGLAGLAFAAAGGMRSSGSGGFVLLPQGMSGGSPSSSIQASPAALADDGQVSADGKIADAYICVFRAGAVGRGNERAEANRSANAGGGSVGHVYSHALQGFSVHASAQGIARMQANNPRIDYCEQDQVMQVIDPVQAQGKPGGGGGTQPAEVTPPGITLVNGGATSGFSGVAWVIDTGIDLDHPDLNVDVARSVNKVTRETSPNDLNGHGSHVAGTIAGIDNDIGTVGVAAGATVIAVRVLDRRGSGSNSDVIAGVDHVAANGRPGDVANMSLGGGVSTALDTAVVNAAQTGVVFAVAAGNDGGDANLHSPARANGANLFTIAAFSPHTGVWASFSNYGKPPVDYAEPGVSIFSTWKDGGYNTISGTSMATPHFAGLVLIGYRDGGTVTRVAGDSYVIAKH